MGVIRKLACSEQGNYSARSSRLILREELRGKGIGADHRGDDAEIVAIQKRAKGSEEGKEKLIHFRIHNFECLLSMRGMMVALNACVITTTSLYLVVLLYTS